MSSTDTGTEGGSRVLGVSCNHCGAPLSVPGDARFITCTYCGARLEVHRTGGAAYTQVLDKIDQRTERIEQDVTELKIRERLDQLDREWMIDRDQYMVRGQNGNASMPNATGAIVGSVVAGVFGIFWIGFAISMGAPFFFPLFGVVFIIAAIAGGISASNKANGYSNAERIYQTRRRQLLNELEQK